MKLKSFRLKINNPTTIEFYTKVLGMQLQNTFDLPKGVLYILYFENQNYTLELFLEKEENTNPYLQKADDNYWKYSLFVYDIQRVYHKIKEHNIPIGEPYQFGDVGYLSHTQDTEHHQIEFIQKTFKQNTIQTAPKENFPLLENPTMGLLTIRTKDPVKSVRFYEDLFDMKLLVRMQVERGRGFTLYFLGNKELTPPSQDIDAIENREWMYQQNHLFIEIQYYWGSEHDHTFALHSNPLGFASLTFVGDVSVIKNKLQQSNISFSDHQDGSETKNQIHFSSIDGLDIIVSDQ
ncbi:VOC family protein [Aquimarina algicola]|uniref:VOC domain-containing protein n=1 Tax=Aquimarina algicola TaxID=2589995 RepID=A0A504JFJ0_9FLAO|nr:VOC family protein [Aquimarina algicola]TPN85181.1 hypothetical protein FHK87_14225 [Aquimarina algicola]